MLTSRRLAVLPVVALLAAGALGCSGDEEDGGDAEPSDETGAGTGDNTVSPEGLPRVPRLRDAQGAVADIEFGDCATDAGQQTVSGSATNGTDRRQDYVIAFSWVNDTSDVLGRGIAVLRDLEGGASADWELSAEVVEGATDCVPNVMRGVVANSRKR